MVSSTLKKETKAETTSSPAVGIPAGDYRLVGWAVDSTGRKITDEICRIAGYTPSSHYEQCVMPYNDLSPPATKRHRLKIITKGKYRLLRDMKNNQILRTKSAISALTEFISWLETVKGDAADGIILVYHEPRKVIPAMLLESLSQYNLLDRFSQIVKGFANGYNVAEAKCTGHVTVYSLRTLSPILLSKTVEVDNAVDRAQLALQIIQHLSETTNEKAKEDEATNGCGDSDVANKSAVEFIRDFVQPTNYELEELADLKLTNNRENTMRPIFTELNRNRRERQHATVLRRLLAEAGMDYQKLKDLWDNGSKEALDHLVKEDMKVTSPKDQQVLLTVLECHFDPEKKPQQQTFDYKDYKKTSKRKFKKAVRDRIKKENIDNNNKVDSGTESPDSTTIDTPTKEHDIIVEDTKQQIPLPLSISTEV